MKILVTGASGHVGNNLIVELIKRQYEVRILIRDEFPKYLSYYPLDVYEGNILDQERMIALTQGIDIVFHLAAKIAISNRHADEVLQTNVQGTKNIVHACLKNKVKKLVHFSSIHAFNLKSRQLINEHSPLALESLNSYDQSKAQAEKIVLDSCKHGLNAVVVNPTGIIGPNDHKLSLMGNALVNIFKGYLPILVQGGFNFVDVRDVVQGAITAAEKGQSGQRYILGGHDINMQDLVQLISTVKQKKMTRLFLPPNLLKPAIPMMALISKVTNTEPLMTRYSLETLMHPPLVDCTKAKTELGYKKTEIQTTIKDTLHWFSQQGNIRL